MSQYTTKSQTYAATQQETDQAALSLFGAMLTMYSGRAFPEDVAAEVNRLIGRFGYEGGLSCSQIAGVRERMTDALAETVAAMSDIERPYTAGDLRRRAALDVSAAAKHPPRLPIAIFGQGEYATVIEEVQVRG